MSSGIRLKKRTYTALNRLADAHFVAGEWTGDDPDGASWDDVQREVKAAEREARAAIRAEMRAAGLWRKEVPL